MIYYLFSFFVFFFFQAEDGIRDLVRSRGLGDVYKRQILVIMFNAQMLSAVIAAILGFIPSLRPVLRTAIALSLIHI